ncbi:MAG: exodeoxyribonuclease VII small subunit [Chloroflexi bacterium]|nr:exodeoxyribonuclease VII small subunit [Chloroflexota bacterium]
MTDEHLSFENAFQELQETVRKLEAGGLTLEESLALFERGTELATLCNEQLDQAELRVRQLLPAPDGDVEAMPFEDWEPEAGAEFPFRVRGK